jgi:glycosyltransferase involved in cell wall biosynthesis
VLILTSNEENHIRRCLESLRELAPNEIYVVDCFSQDATVDIAKSLGAKVIRHVWPGAQALQFNWALDHLPIETEWVLRLDADEYLRPELIEEIKDKLPKLAADITGIYLPLERTFLGKKVSRGVGKITIMRLFRLGHARYPERMMDERLELIDGRDITFDAAFVDDNINGFEWWCQKHVGYAMREARAMLAEECGLSEACGKKAFYSKMPLFFRCFIYWGYRYFLRLGFLDGLAGWRWHFWQGLWYRLLVDRKVLEIKKACGYRRERIIEYLGVK